MNADEQKEVDYNDLKQTDRWALWTKKNPWYKSYNLARERCKPHNKYGIRGIKFLMTIRDFELLWKRDKAHNMKRPSIDRINSNGNYILNNCRFIELKLNKERQIGAKWTKEMRQKQSERMFRAYEEKRLKNGR